MITSGAAGSCDRRIDTERHDQRIRAVPLDGPHSSSSAASHGSSPDPGGIGSLTVAPLAGAAADLVGVADEVREPAGGRIDVHAGVEHVAAVPEDLLRAVALVGVDVDDRDPFEPTVAQPLRRGGRVVEVARPAEERRAGMVARRANRGVRGTLAAGHEVGGVDRGVDRGARGVERAGR